MWLVHSGGGPVIFGGTAKKSNLLMYEQTMPIKRSQNVTINQCDVKFSQFRDEKNFIRQMTKALVRSRRRLIEIWKEIIRNVNWIIFFSNSTKNKFLIFVWRGFRALKRFFYSISCCIEKCCVTILIFPEHNNTNRVAFCTFKGKPWERSETKEKRECCACTRERVCVCVGV